MNYFCNHLALLSFSLPSMASAAAAAERRSPFPARFRRRREHTSAAEAEAEPEDPEEASLLAAKSSCSRRRWAGEGVEMGEGRDMAADVLTYMVGRKSIHKS